MTRDKERLAEEVIELKRVNDDVATRLKLAQAEVIRATGELRKRERALEALERGDDDGGAARRATRVLELEAENEVYLSEVARLASLLRLDPETGQLPGTSAGPSPDVPGADDEATSNETGFRTASSAEVARLRAELAFGAKHAFESEIPHDLTAEHALTLAEARATNAEARVASLERAAAEATDSRDAAAALAEASEARAAALASALAKAEEDRNHFRNLAAMEAAAAEEAAEEAAIADAECARVRPELDSLRRQIADVAERAERARARKPRRRRRANGERRRRCGPPRTPRRPPSQRQLPSARRRGNARGRSCGGPWRPPRGSRRAPRSPRSRRRTKKRRRRRRPASRRRR